MGFRARVAVIVVSVVVWDVGGGEYTVGNPTASNLESPEQGNSSTNCP